MVNKVELGMTECIVTGPEAPCIMGIEYSRRWNFKTKKDNSVVLV